MRGAPTGSRNGRAKLTVRQVRAAWRAYQAHSRTNGARALARRCGVSHSRCSRRLPASLGGSREPRVTLCHSSQK
jgi:hypothetical protein